MTRVFIILILFDFIVGQSFRHKPDGGGRMNDCIFCKIAAGAIPADIVYEDDSVRAFRDIDPKAPVHVVIIPRDHVATLNDISGPELAGRMMLAAVKTAAVLGLRDNGYRIVANCNADGGQTVFHIHLHLLGGRPMKWPPG